MALALTCACGARLELEETLAGQEVSCPSCGKPVRVPTVRQAPLRTSGWALASAILALIGAFSLIGTLAAIVLGLVALHDIRRNRERVAGTGYALFGITAGAILTGLTVLALTPGELFGLGGWWRERNLRELVDRAGPMTIDRGLDGYSITRPTPRWGVLKVNVVPEPSLEGLSSGCDLILLDPRKRAYLDVRIDRSNRHSSLDQCRERVLEEFEPIANFDRHRRSTGRGYRLVREEELPGGPNHRARRLIVETQRGGQTWWFCLQLYKMDEGPLYVVRGFVVRRLLGLAEADLQKGLASFQLFKP